MADTNVNEKSPAWRRLAAFRESFSANFNKLIKKLYPKKPKAKFPWGNLTASQKRRVFKEYKKLVKKSGRQKGMKLMKTNPVNLKNYDKDEELLKIIEKMPQRKKRIPKPKDETPVLSSDKPRLLSINGRILFPLTCKKCEKTSERRISLSESHMSVDSNQIAVIFGLEAGRCEECGELYQVEFIR